MAGMLRGSAVWIRIGKLVIPIGASAAYVIWVHLADLTAGGRLLPLLTAYVVPPFGKESIIPLALALGVSPVFFVFSIILIDFLVALFLAWNFHLTHRIPLVGWYLKRAELHGERILATKTWVKRLSLAGLLIFMVIPLQGTGALTTSIIGRVLGLGAYRVLAVVLVGSTISSLVVAFFANTLFSFFRIWLV